MSQLSSALEPQSSCLMPTSSAAEVTSPVQVMLQRALQGRARREDTAARELTRLSGVTHLLRICTRAVRFQSPRSWPQGYEAPLFPGCRVSGGPSGTPGNKAHQGDQENEECGFTSRRRFTWAGSLVCKGPESKYLRLCRLNERSLNFSVLSLEREKSCGLSSLFTKPGRGPDSALRP